MKSEKGEPDSLTTMLGYVQALKTELLVREYEIYQGYYCGLCKEIGDRYGQVFRPALSYDMTFLAVFLSSLEDTKDNLAAEHCILHPIAKKPVIRCGAVSYAADMMILLGRENLQDDLNDRDTSHLLSKRTLSVPLEHAYRKASRLHPETAREIRSHLDTLASLEAEKSGDLDRVPNAFAKLLRAVFLGFRTDSEKSEPRVLGEFSENLGRWIYLADALEDYEKDVMRGSYNPFRYQTDPTDSPVSEIRERNRDLLYHELGEAAMAYELLDIKKNRGILNNIIYLGLRKETDDILEGKKAADHGNGSKRSI